MTFLTPTRVSGNTFRYAFTGTFSGTGIVTVRFLPNSFSDNTSGSGTPNAGETEQFYTRHARRATQQPNPPAPIAVLASPANGESLTAQALNARALHRRHVHELRRHGDRQGRDPRRGAGVHDHRRRRRRPAMVDDDRRTRSSSASRPLDRPALPATATTVTYRYFLKDKNTQNATDLFQPGEVTVTFIADAPLCTGAGSVHAAAAATAPASRRRFTLSAAAPGAATADRSPSTSGR